MAYIDFYHYTSETGKDAIKRVEKILRSEGLMDSDVRFGKGVYGTTMTPDNGIGKIAFNNYGPAANRNKELRKKVEWAIKVRIQETEVKNVSEGNRNIRLYEGDIDLKKYTWTVIQVPE